MNLHKSIRICEDSSNPPDLFQMPESSATGQTVQTFDHVARQASIRFSGLAIDKLLGYVFALLVAKTFGSTVFGLYIFGVGLFEITYALTELGLERSAIRAIAESDAHGKHAEVRAIVRSTLSLMVPVGAVVALVGVAFGPLLAELLGRPELGPFLRIGAIAIPAWLVGEAFLWATEGLGSQRYMVTVRLVVEPLVKIAFTLLLYLPFSGADGATALAIAYASAIVISAVLAYVSYRKFVLPRATGQPVGGHAAELLRLGLPVCGLTLLQRALQWWDIFLTFTVVSAMATTHYTVAYRTAMLTLMISNAFEAAFKPAMAAALAQGRREAVREEFQKVSRTVLMTCLPAIVMLTVFPGRIMPVLGDQFIPAASICAVVAFGTLVSMLAGPASSALTMAGRTRVPFVNGLAAAAIGVTTGLVLVRRYGALGVAIGQCTSLCLANIFHSISARRILGVFGIGRQHATLALAAAVAVAAGLGASAIAPSNKYAAFAAVGVAVTVAYIATLTIAGVNRDDWRFVRNVLGLVPGLGRR